MPGPPAKAGPIGATAYAPPGTGLRHQMHTKPHDGRHLSRDWALSELSPSSPPPPLSVCLSHSLSSFLLSLSLSLSPSCCVCVFLCVCLCECPCFPQGAPPYDIMKRALF